MINTKALNTKYALIQSLYFVVLCALMSYGALYLGEIGLKAGIIGIIMAVGNVMTTLLQPALASYVDKHHLPVYNVLSVMAIICAIIAGGMIAFTKVPVVVGILFALIFGLSMTMTPFLNAMTFAFEKHGVTLNYGLTRGLGSAAYAITSLVLGYVVKIMNPTLLPIVPFVAIVGLIPLIRGFRLKGVEEVEDESHEKEESSESLVDFCKKYKVFFLLLVGFMLVYIDHQIINTYMIYIVKNIGGTSSAMGIATFIAAILELPAMSLFQKYKDRLNISHIMMFAGSMFTIKHILTVFSPNMVVFFIAQMLQMFAYALFIPASVFYVDKLFDKRDSVKGQALMTMATTVAGILANVFGGFMIDLTGVNSTLIVFAVISVAGTIVLVASLSKINKMKAS